MDSGYHACTHCNMPKGNSLLSPLCDLCAGLESFKTTGLTFSDRIKASFACDRLESVTGLIGRVWESKSKRGQRKYVAAHYNVNLRPQFEEVKRMYF